MIDELSQTLQNLTVQVVSRIQPGAAGGTASTLGETILVTSAREGEGKSFIAEALARYAVQITASRVLLVDANPDNPTLHRSFRVTQGPGLMEFLARSQPVETLIHADVVPGLSLLAFGMLDAPGLLMQGEALSAFFAFARARYDLVIIDGSVLKMAARSLLDRVSGAVVVIDAGATRREVVSGTLGALHVQREKVLGVVLNKRPLYIPRLLYRFI